MDYSNMTEQEIAELYERFEKFVSDSEDKQFELLTLVTAISSIRADKGLYSYIPSDSVIEKALYIFRLIISKSNVDNTEEAVDLMKDCIDIGELAKAFKDMD
jgi:hypothetical protein